MQSLQLLIVCAMRKHILRIKATNKHAIYSQRCYRWTTPAVTSSDLALARVPIRSPRKLLIHVAHKNVVRIEV